MLVHKFFIGVFLVLFLLSCEQVEVDEVKEVSEKEASINFDKLESGFIRIRVNDDLYEKIEKSADSVGIIRVSTIKSVNDVFQELNVVYMTRTFPYAGRFEERTRKEGMHLWFDVIFDESVNLTKAKYSFSNLEGVKEVEYRPKMVLIGNGNPIKVSIEGRNSNDELPFNDPQLGNQWHYYNDGSISGSVAGCDINVLNVWKNYTVGSSDVIVSIVDGGIDYNHEDLSANMWINEAEMNGSSGVDDDGNGYIDDKYGYNFVSNGPRIIADNHGTHVAGTVGAVNNNGIGVCGVAGGNYLAGIGGVKLMSCQIFEPGKSTKANGANAIKYGADNGAVISQNSWGYDEGTYTPASDKAAIDYFVKYAGIDENGNQIGPMKGGIVVFAAGNDNLEIGYPAEYEGAFAVAALAHDYKRAYYSNYGSWVDISAPGGDYNKGVQVLSTLADNSYGKMQGTSMACPHVSGVAALVVSYFGGPGFTVEMLRERLVNAATNIDSYNVSLTGKLGSGIINTLNAIASSSTIAPDLVDDFAASTFSNNINVCWTVPEDEDDNVPYGFTIYYSKNSLASFDGTNLEGVNTISYETGSLEVGDTVSQQIQNLDFETGYDLLIVAYDLSSNKSEYSDVIHVTTEANESPVITAVDETNVVLKMHETVGIRFGIVDPDNHSVACSLSDERNELSLVEITGGVQVSITAKNADAGCYQVNLVATDYYGATDVVTINYTIEANHAPSLIKDIDSFVFGAVGQKVEVNLSEYFEDVDGEILQYAVQSTSASVAHINVSGNDMYVTAMGFGMTEVTLTGTDVMGKFVNTTFKILVRDQSRVVDLYPNPVVDILNVRTSAEKEVSISIKGTSGAVVYEGNLTVSPFNPGQVNMSGIDSGVYTINVELDGSEFSSTIIKL